MGLDWPAISSVSADLAEDVQTQVRQLLDALADVVRAELAKQGLAPAASSPLFRPWGLIVVVDAEKVAAYFTQLHGGVAQIRWLDRSGEILPFAPQQIAAELGSPVLFAASFPRAALDDSAQAKAAIESVATDHLHAIERAMSIGRVGDLTGLQHLARIVQ